MGRVSTYRYPSAFPLPSVNDMITAGGAGYSDNSAYPPFPASNLVGRTQTPISRVNAVFQPTPTQPFNQRAGGGIY